jgi:hypothetical protein
VAEFEDEMRAEHEPTALPMTNRLLLNPFALLVALAAASGCASHRSPVAMNDCWRHVRYTRHYVEYTFTLKNDSHKPVAAVRAGFASIGTERMSGLESIS